MWTIRVLALTGPVLLLSMLWEHPLAYFLFALGTTVLAVALMRLGAARRGNRAPNRRLDLILGPLWIVLSACLMGIIYYADSSWAPWGVPVGAWLLLAGLWLLPLLWVSLGYAATFDRFGLRQEDLHEVRRAARRRGEES
ncbi:MAG TPA: hypothetical protein VLV83_00530 [Acidobacteriota bacterium]|nr:hypothetical protein [Acidobacteriota bacterium]